MSIFIVIFWAVYFQSELEIIKLKFSEKSVMALMIIHGGFNFYAVTTSCILALLSIWSAQRKLILTSAGNRQRF